MNVLAALQNMIAPAHRAPAQPAASANAATGMTGDRLALHQSRAGQLLEANREAGSMLLGALGQMARHPLKTVGSFFMMMLEPFIHPVRAFNRCKDAFKSDGPLEGAMYTSLYTSAAITTLSFFAMGLALLAAPFTGGASLAIVPFASTVMVWTGYHDAAMTVAILLKDEADAMTADTPDRLGQEEGQLADDFLNTFFAWATLPLSDAETAATIAPQGLMLAGRSSLRPHVRLLTHFHTIGDTSRS
jgi:hypothetical protein